MDSIMDVDVIVQTRSFRAPSVSQEWSPELFLFINFIQIYEPFQPGIVPGADSGVTERALKGVQ